MKKIIAILLALAVVSMAFAQTVSITNEVGVEPTVTVGWQQGLWGASAAQWSFGDFYEKISGDATTEDSRAGIHGEAKFVLKWMDNGNVGLGYYTGYNGQQSSAPTGFPFLLSNKTTSQAVSSFTPRWVMSVEGAGKGWVKPFEFLKIQVGKDIGISVGNGFAFQAGTTDISKNKPYALDSDRQKVVRDGIAFQFLGEGVGIDGLTVTVGFDTKGLSTAWLTGTTANWTGVALGTGDLNNAVIKKNMFGQIGIGAQYKNPDVFSVGLAWRMMFGLAEAYHKQTWSDNTSYDAVYNVGIKEWNNAGAKTYATDINDGSYPENKTYSNQSIYVGGSFYGLKDLPISIKEIYAAASIVMNNGQIRTTDIGIGAGVDIDFNNGIQTKPEFSVAFATGGNSYKSLPFGVQNTLTFKPSDEFKFSLLTAYSQEGLPGKMKGYIYRNGTASGDSTTTNAGRFFNSDSAITLDPECEFKTGKHTFCFGVKTVVDGTRQYVEKTDFDWAYTRTWGTCAKITFPIKWKYTF